MALHETHKYDDIIDMPHHVSRRHPQMSRRQRAAQFMPFAALKGYYDLIRERERVAEPKRELTDEQALELSRKLSQLKRREMACIVHYDGEAYVTARGLVSDIDLAARTVTVVRTRIPLDDIADIRTDA